MSRSEWVTPYTPYQPEISQGTLQVIFEFQSMICRLLGADVAMASHYDGATATYEAALLAVRATKRNKVLVARSIHPEYVQTLRTILHPAGCEIDEVAWDATGAVDKNELAKLLDDKTACIIFGYPNFLGVVEDVAGLSKLATGKGALSVAVVMDPVALGLLEAPGKLGADVIVGEGQSLGIGVNFGGPGLGLFAAKEKFIRNMPGRIVGETVDVDGRRSFVLTFATREQHIRREKATSNICSNQALCASRAAMFLSIYGAKGMQELATQSHAKANYLKKKLSALAGVKIAFGGPSFHEFVLTLPKDATAVFERLAVDGVMAGVPLARWFKARKNDLLVNVTEVVSKGEMDEFAKLLEGALK